MELTYQLRADLLTETLLESIKDQFRGREISIVVKDVQDTLLADEQKIAFTKMEDVRAELKSVKIDPSVDISSLADQVNL